MIDYDRLAADYARHRQVHPEVLRGLLNGLGASARVLEVGCGTGNYISRIALATGCACWGIDPSAEMLARARAQAPTVQLQIGRAEQLGFAAGAFDLVFSVDVIHHVQDRPQYYREALRVLAPGGRVCTVTDSEWIIRNRRPLSLCFPETVPVELQRYPAIGALRQMMAAAAFADIAEDTVEFAYDLADIQPYRDRAYSSLHLIPDEAFLRGLARMEQDLQRGPIPCVSRYTLLWGQR